MTLGYDSLHLRFLIIWSLVTVLSMALYRWKEHKFFLGLPPLISLISSGLELYRYTLVSDSVNIGCFFLFVLSLLHLIFSMMIDQRATDWSTKLASHAGLLTAGFAYFTSNIFVFALFWILSTVPSFFSFDTEHRRAKNVCLTPPLLLLLVYC